MSTYSMIGDFGSSPESQSNPLSYCFVSGLDSGAYHTLGNKGLSGPDRRNCQLFTAAYCANEWNDICEYASKDTQSGPMIVNQVSPCISNYNREPLTKGEILIRNTMAEKYLKKMSANCKRSYEEFDPTTGNSPLISSWVPMTGQCGSTKCNGLDVCIPVYGIDPKTVDNDRVMDLALQKPSIAMDIFVNIYNNALNDGSLDSLRGTKVYAFFMSPMFRNALTQQ